MRILIVASLCLHYFLLIFASDVAIWRSLTQFGDIPSPDSDPLFAYDSHSQIVWFIGGDDLSTAFFTNQYLRYGRLNFDSGEYAVTWTNTSFSFPYHITAGGMSLFQRVDPSDNSNMLSSLIYYYGFGQYDTQVAYCDEIVMLQVSVLFFFPVYLTRCDCCLQYRTSVNQSLASSSPPIFLSSDWQVIQPRSANPVQAVQNAFLLHRSFGLIFLLHRSFAYLLSTSLFPACLGRAWFGFASAPNLTSSDTVFRIWAVMGTVRIRIALLVFVVVWCWLMTLL